MLTSPSTKHPIHNTKAMFNLLKKSLSSSGENKTMKTISGLLGELVLVVAGILIALSVDDWRAGRQKTKDEIVMLENFSNELKTDLDNFNITIAHNKNGAKSLDIIINVLENDLPYHDSLNKHFGTAMSTSFFTYGSSTFKTLNSVGIDLISAQGIRDKIIKNYEVNYKMFKATEQAYNDIVMSAAKNILNTRFDQFYKTKGYTVQPMIMKPMDFDALKNDPEFLYFLKSLRNQHKVFLDSPCAVFNLELAVLIAMIDHELKTLTE